MEKLNYRHSKGLSPIMQQLLVCCVGEPYGSSWSHRIVISIEPLRLECTVFFQVIRPAEANGLVPKLRFHHKRPLAIGKVYRVLDPVAATHKIGILSSASVRDDLRIRRLLVKSAGEQTIVLEVPHGR